MTSQTSLDTHGLGDCPNQGWCSQFGHPRGLLGRLAEMHELAVERLEVGPDHRVLEIGFGHGRMLGARVLATGGRLLLCLRMHDPQGGRYSSPEAER